MITCTFGTENVAGLHKTQFKSHLKSRITELGMLSVVRTNWCGDSGMRIRIQYGMTFIEKQRVKGGSPLILSIAFTDKSVG